MNLYRNTRDSKVAGVCAGLADHWDVAHWVVRLTWSPLSCLPVRWPSGFTWRPGADGAAAEPLDAGR